jgi:superfamily II RNA helicase
MVKICNESYPNPSPTDEIQTLFDKYPFSLSDFQKYAIQGILEGQHVLATAHTGSGKTLPAEFAIEHFVRTCGRRVIYTSPIKALSNQKYYEFTRKFPGISFGLITGDIKTNPDADVLIMTTEILMNYLYKYREPTVQGTNGSPVPPPFLAQGPTGLFVGGEAPSLEGSIVGSPPSSSLNLDFQIDIANELACVVFDEVHYINDADRGQTWENTILMLPKHIQMVMLSATIDAPEKFAHWCERGGGGVEGPEVWLVSTHHRVVPLTHYSFMTTTESIFKQVKDKALEQEIRKNTNCLTVLQTADGAFSETALHKIRKMSGLFDKYQIRMKRKHVLNALLMHLREQEQLPAIFFVFSRKQVEQCAKEVSIRVLADDSKVPYTVARECEAIVHRFPNHKEYLELPEYLDLVKLLECGIGIHHSGMIPVLREIVEIMISKKYINVLFATESFAIGLDCPIKTAVFTSLTKFDGKGPRYLHSHEYTQMAGRAGRRGIDTVGNVIHCNNLFDLPSVLEYRAILQGPPQKLVSKFRISHGLILRLFDGGDETTTTTSTSSICQYMEKSMMYDRIRLQMQQCLNRINSINLVIQEKRKVVSNRTPLEICEKYALLNETLNFSNHKKRKECEREIARLTDEWRHIKEDYTKVFEIRKLELELKEENGHYEYLENYIQLSVGHILKVLVDGAFVCPTGILDGWEVGDGGGEVGETYRLLPKGRMAAQLAEIDSLIFVQTFMDTRQFVGLSTEDLVEIFSCWTGIKVAEEYAVHTVPDTVAVGVKQVISAWGRWAETYERMEMVDDVGLSFALLGAGIREWTTCMTEQECKWYLQTRIHTMGISTGDFTKAVLKIATIGREVAAMAEREGLLELLVTLSRIDDQILKFIVVNQSLYV